MSSSGTIKGNLTFLFKLALLSLLFVSLINFLAEIYYSLKYKENDYSQNLIDKVDLPVGYDPEFVTQHAKDGSILKTDVNYSHALTFGRNYTNAKTFKGSKDGRRITPAKYLVGKAHQGFLLGASLTWGYFAPEDKLLSNVINQRLDSVGIDNYSIQGALFANQLLYWQLNKENLADKEFVLAVGGTFEMLKYCLLEPAQFVNDFKRNNKKPVLGLEFVYNKIIERVSKPKTLNACTTKEDIDIVIQKIMNNVNLLLLEAKFQGKRIKIIFAPTPYYGNPLVSNVSDIGNFQEVLKILNPLYERLDNHLKSINDPRIINFMHVFNDGKSYYIDKEGHLNAEGHAKFADEMLKQIGIDFFIGK